MVADRDAGRSWTVGELRSRDWDSLHQLWWVCVKERNRLATEKLERKRLENGRPTVHPTNICTFDFLTGLTVC